MNKLDKQMIEMILELDRYEIGSFDPIILQIWLRQLGQEVLDLRRELEESHNCDEVGCPWCGM